jgi:hypothetical protein
MRRTRSAAFGTGLVWLAGLFLLIPHDARATDEIQVYNAEIAAVGQFTLQQHLNYAIQGRTEPDFPGALISHHSLNGTPELAYGVTDWYELGLYAPFAVDAQGQFLSDGFKIRHLFVSPDAAKRNLFYGLNFEFSYMTPKFSESRFALEIRPIIGIRQNGTEFIVNPIVDVAVGGTASFTPALRVAHDFARDFALGLEYYADLGPIGAFSAPENQSHQIFAVTDFKLGTFDVDFGLGYGLTPGSDGLVAKMILGRALNEPASAVQRLPRAPVR